MRKDDLDAVHNISIKTLEEYYDPGIFEYYLDLWPQGQFVVTDNQDNVIGFSICDRMDKFTGHILMFAITPEFQSRGLGTMLMTVIRGNLSFMGVKRLILEVNADNVSAKKFYKRNGFMETDILDHYYQSGDTGIRMIASAELYGGQTFNS